MILSASFVAEQIVHSDRPVQCSFFHLLTQMIKKKNWLCHVAYWIPNFKGVVIAKKVEILKIETLPHWKILLMWYDCWNQWSRYHNIQGISVIFFHKCNEAINLALWMVKSHYKRPSSDGKDIAENARMDSITEWRPLCLHSGNEYTQSPWIKFQIVKIFNATKGQVHCFQFQGCHWNSIWHCSLA